MAPYPLKSRTRFALAHAVKLAEGGDALRDRRIGASVSFQLETGQLTLCPHYQAYQYCIQHLPQGDDLHLMLVNTVRKVRPPRRIGIRISLDPIFRI